MTAHDGLGSVRADVRKAATDTHWDPATARLIDTAVAERDAWWRGQVEALAGGWERLAAGNEAARGKSTKVAGYYRRCAHQLRDLLDAVPQPETTPAQPVPAPSDWHDPAQREAAGMGRDHDRTILEGALEHDRTVVMVRCPHTVGLCYLTDGPDGEEGWLANLPCPCNDRSEIVAHVVPTVPGVCGVQYGDNPDRCCESAGHPGPHSNCWGTTWAGAR